MPYRNTFFVNGGYYHLFNRGIDKQLIFKQKKDYIRFLECLKYYKCSGNKPKFSQRLKFKSFIAKHQSPFILKTENPLVEIIAYCLMPNHFHLLVKQLQENGIQEFISKLCNSHSSFFNLKYKREGDLFQSEFKTVLVETDEQLLHLSRYIHLNPFVANLVKNPEDYQWSSCKEYFENTKGICQKQEILYHFKKSPYKNFVMDHAHYAKQLHQIQHLLLE